MEAQVWSGLERTVDATSELMELEDAKDHLRVDHTDEDTLITSLIAAAREAVEERTSRATINQTWVLKLDAFPAGELEIRLPRPPLVSVTSVTYVDADGATQTWGAANYVVSTSAVPGAIRLAYNATWPTTRLQPNAVTITYVAGYGASASTVPPGLIAAAKLILADLYELREGAITGTIHTANPTVDRLLGPHVVRFY